MPVGMTPLGWAASSSPTTIGVFAFEPLPSRKVLLRSSTAPIQQYLIRELNKIEPCASPIWGWQYRQNVNSGGSLSEHSAGTAFDYNAPKHPNGERGTWGDNAIRVLMLLRSIDKAAGTAVFRWGENYKGTPDGMHFEVVSQQAANAAINGLNLDINGVPKTPVPPTEDPMAQTVFPFIARYKGTAWLVRGTDKVRVLNTADLADMLAHDVADLGDVGSRFLTYWPEGQTGDFGPAA